MYIYVRTWCFIKKFAFDKYHPYVRTCCTDMWCTYTRIQTPRRLKAPAAKDTHSMCGYKGCVREFAWPSVVVCEDRRREGEGRARWVCSELGAQSRPPDIVGGGAVRESLSIAAEKDERIVLGPAIRMCVYVCVSKYAIPRTLKAPKRSPDVAGPLNRFRRLKGECK